MSTGQTQIDTNKVKVSIKMIKLYVKEVDTSAVIDVLESMVETPDDSSLIQKLHIALQPLGISQGTVLTYAPYLAVLQMNNIDEMGLDD